MADIYPKAQKRTEKELEYQYSRLCIQRSPKYGLFTNDWTTIHGSITNELIHKHVTGQSTIGTLRRWYPEYALLDVDHVKYDYVLHEVRKEFGIAAEEKALVFETSPGSYHIMFRAQYNGRPATAALLEKILDPIAKRVSSRLSKVRDVKEVVLYPKESRVIRAPFHPNCKIINREQCETLQEKLDEFLELSVIDMKDLAKRMPRRRLDIGRTMSGDKISKRAKLIQYGKDVYLYGMERAEETRYSTQFAMMLYFRYMNFTKDQAREEYFEWVHEKAYGYSDLATLSAGDNPDARWQLEREVEWCINEIWDTCDDQFILPATTHNGYHGWFTEKDLVLAAKHCGGKIAYFKSLSQVLAYFNAQRKMTANIHFTKWQEMCSRPGTEMASRSNYVRHIRFFEETGLAQRGSSFLVGEFSKQFTMNIRPSFAEFTSSATLTDGMDQALTFEESLEALGRKEVYDMLTQNGFTASAAWHFVENRSLI